MPIPSVMAAVLLALALAAQAQTADPAAVELELWRAAARLDIPEAYRAYLAQYPTGAFAPMAKMAIDKAGGTRPAAAETAPAVANPSGYPDKAALSKLYGPDAESGALSMQAGDRMVGPGVATIGWWGAKRQIAVPAGEWVVLAAFDHRWGQGALMAQLTTVLLGQFNGLALNSLLAVTTNTRPVPAPTTAGGDPYSMRTWRPAVECQRPQRPPAYRDVQTVGDSAHCAALFNTVGDPLSMLPGAQQRFEAALNRLGVPTPEFGSRTEVHIDSPLRRGLISYVRLDAKAAAPAERIEWLKAFVPRAVDGEARRVAGDDLPVLSAALKR